VPPGPTPPRALGRVPALDSLRAIAVLLVLGTHVWAVFPSAPGAEGPLDAGFLGVDLFFVLSGFLITALLLEEHDASAGIGLHRFYARRALRLLPAMLLFLAVYAVYGATNDWPPFGRADFFGDSVQATLLYYMNWRVLWNPLGAADLTAIWSLSIEEQYYFAWPLLLLGLLSWRRLRPHAGWLLAGAAVAVTAWRLVVFERLGWEAAYLRTDTRIDGLLWGSLGGWLFVNRRLPTSLPRWTPLAVIGLWVPLLALVRADERNAYAGGITLWVLSSLVLVVHLANRPDAFTRGRVATLSRGLGRVSYAAYLWQLPVLRAVERWTPDWERAPRIAASLALLAACTAASWFAVERPALALKRRVAARRAGEVSVGSGEPSPHPAPG